MRSASHTNDARMCSAIAQPTTRRDAKSITDGRARSEEVEDQGHPDPMPLDRRLPETDRRVDDVRARSASSAVIPTVCHQVQPVEIEFDPQLGVRKRSHKARKCERSPGADRNFWSSRYEPAR